MVNPSLNATAVLYTDFTLGAIVSTTYLSDVIGEVSLATFESALLVAPANSKLYSNPAIPPALFTGNIFCTP